MLHDDGGEAGAGVARHRPAVPRGLRGAARGGGSRAVARADGADRRTGHGQDDDGGAAAGVARQQARDLRIALAAPTGKAAARLQEAVQLEVGKLDAADQEALSGLHATTLHRLLGSRPDTSARFRHNRGNRLPHDVIVVDETSMVSLTMMARLLEAVRPERG